ncbi:MAG: hypothetical protein N2C14_12910 [Planctomycetales bacterium]
MNVSNSLPAAHAKFTPSLRYFGGGDYLTYFVRDKRCPARRPAPWLTIHETDDGEFVGLKLSNVRQRLQSPAGLGGWLRGHGFLGWWYKMAPRQFKPYSVFHRETDALSVYFRASGHRDQRVDATLTLFLSGETEELVGLRLHGVAAMLPK